MSNVSISQLGDAIMAQLETFERNVRQGVREAVDETMDDMVRETKGTAQANRGRYKSAISKTVLENTMMSYTKVWHVKKPRTGLAHLLDKGHKLRNGGYKAGNGHVANAEQRAVEAFERKIEEVIRNAGS